MRTNKGIETMIVNAIMAGSTDYRVNGKSCDGDRWPAGNHYYVVDDLTHQKTYHIPVDSLSQAAQDAMDLATVYKN